VALLTQVHLRTFAVATDVQAKKEVSHLQQRGEAWLLSHRQHTAGVYGFFSTETQAAKQQEQDLCWWETSPLSERRYRIGEEWYNLRPDALAAYRVGSQQIRFWFGWDRGTMNARDLATKFLSYAHYIESREWATLPLLVCIAPDIGQVRRIQRVVQAALSRISGLVVCTTTEGMLKEHGPLAPIWTTDMRSNSHMVSRSGPSRKLVFHMHSEKEAP